MRYNYLRQRLVPAWAVGLLGTAMGLDLCYGLVELGVMSAWPEVMVDETLPLTDAQYAMLMAIAGLAGLSLLVTVPTVVMFCIWIVRANRNARALGAESMKVSPGWSAGWFFIPFANWVMPCIAMCEIARASDPAVSGREWRRGALPAVVPLWWTAWVASALVGQVSWQLDGSPGLLAMSYWADGVSALLSFAAGVCAIVMIRYVERSQREKARRSPEAGQRVCMTCQYDLRGTAGTHCPECGQAIPGRDAGTFLGPELL